MSNVYLVQHVHLIDNEDEDIKVIGVYSTEPIAQQAVEWLRLQPGFCDSRGGFHIDCYKLDENAWTEFITVDSDDSNATKLIDD